MKCVRLGKRTLIPRRRAERWQLRAFWNSLGSPPPSRRPPDLGACHVLTLRSIGPGATSLPSLDEPSEMESTATVTTLLNEAGAGDSRAAADLLPLVYEQLRALAGRKMRHERPDQTLQATALVHEAYLRLV